MCVKNGNLDNITKRNAIRLLLCHFFVRLFDWLYEIGEHGWQFHIWYLLVFVCLREYGVWFKLNFWFTFEWRRIKWKRKWKWNKRATVNDKWKARSKKHKQCTHKRRIFTANVTEWKCKTQGKHRGVALKWNLFDFTKLINRDELLPTEGIYVPCEEAFEYTHKCHFY